jgi:hypothetical protein
LGGFGGGNFQGPAAESGDGGALGWARPFESSSMQARAVFHFTDDRHGVLSSVLGRRNGGEGEGIEKKEEVVVVEAVALALR